MSSSSEIEIAEYDDCDLDSEGSEPDLRCSETPLSQFFVEDDYPRHTVRNTGGRLPANESIGINVDGEYNVETTIRGTEINDIHGYNEEGTQMETQLDDLERLFEEIDEENEGREYTAGFSNQVCRLYSIPKKRRIVHEVVYFKDRRGCFERIRNSLDIRSQTNVEIIGWHRDHCHYIHDCTYSDNKCKCARALFLRGSRRPNRRVVWTHGVSREYWHNLLLYFQKEGRYYIYVKVGGKLWFRDSEIGGLSIGGNPEFTKGSMVEESDDKEHFYDSVMCGSNENDDGQAASTSNENNAGKRKCQKGKAEDKLLAWLREHPTSPILGVFQSKAFYNSPFVLWNLTKYRNKKIIEIFGRELCDYTINQMNTYANNVYPLYHAINGDVGEYYYSLENSTFVLHELLKYQFNNDINLIKNFLLDLYFVLDKIKPKVNCFLVESPPSAGKNFFFDAVVHFFFNYGQIHNFNKYDQFPLQEAVNKRVLLWNEPSCEPAAFETLKMLFGGDPCSAKIKYESDAVIPRTPIICLTNNDPFPRNEAFRCRMIKYIWKAAPFLVNYKKKPLPLAFNLLLDKYNLHVLAFSETVTDMFDDVLQNEPMLINLNLDNNSDIPYDSDYSI